MAPYGSLSIVLLLMCIDVDLMLVQQYYVTGLGGQKQQKYLTLMAAQATV